MNIGDALTRVIHKAAPTLTFNILEIGAVPLEGETEPFHALLQLFPGSRINAFEVDPDLCARLNAGAPPGLTYHPVPLGRTEEERSFYMTNNPMCASLYKPNERFIEKYNGMEVAMLKETSTIRTVSLDHFVAGNNIGPVDFIKIDIQGAELDVFQGGESTLKDVVAIVSEVEFVHHYENQPLFGDVCGFLAKHGQLFHKFRGLSGRSLRPIIFNNDPYFATQHIWSDAVYIKDPMNLAAFSSDQLLKLAVLMFMYGSPDVSIYCLTEYDDRYGTGLINEMRTASLATAGMPGNRSQ